MFDASSPAARIGTRLSGRDLHAALDALHVIGEASLSTDGFARYGVTCLSQLVSSELTTLSVCDLDTGHRGVVSDRPGAISPEQIQVFDHYFFAHPLVRAHGRNPCAVTRRIADLVPDDQFRRSPLYNDYYRPIRIDHAMAVPIHVDRHVLVSFVFNRTGSGFSDRDRACLELIRPHLGSLYRLSLGASCAAGVPPAPGVLASSSSGAAPPAPGTASPGAAILRSAALGLPLTARERGVLHWLAAGKTDRDIADILSISPRTVHKHLQRIYEKLGVETRTAAVMRVLAAAGHWRRVRVGVRCAHRQPTTHLATCLCWGSLRSPQPTRRRRRLAVRRSRTPTRTGTPTRTPTRTPTTPRATTRP
jgi:DNA-binding CsgD family transcriptional regulator